MENTIHFHFYTLADFPESLKFALLFWPENGKALRDFSLARGWKKVIPPLEHKELTLLHH